MNTSQAATASNETNSAKRGRKAGSKVQSLDYRAARALKAVRFEEFLERMSDGDDNWKDDLIDDIIQKMREKDIF